MTRERTFEVGRSYAFKDNVTGEEHGPKLTLRDINDYALYFENDTTGEVYDISKTDLGLVLLHPV